MPRKKLAPIVASPKGCAESFAVSDRQARRDLTDLVEGGWLERCGGGQPRTESVVFESNVS